MSELKTNKISTNDQNNVAIDNALGLKSYTTTQRNALTSVAGDMIYNTTDSKPQYYNGSSWENFAPNTFVSEYLIIAGGGSGGKGQSGNRGGAGGGGAGGYVNSYANLLKSTNFTVTVGGGGTVSSGLGVDGINSVFSTYTADGGGGGGRPHNQSLPGNDGGSGGGGGAATTITQAGGTATANQGNDGGDGFVSGSEPGGGGGGGAGAVGSDGGLQAGGNGGAGKTSDITGTGITRAGGGGGSPWQTSGSPSYGSGGTGGGGAASNPNGVNGTVNTGGGGGAVWQTGTNGLGGSGVVIIRWLTADATIGATRTGLVDGGVQTDGIHSYIEFTGGTGTISFS